jgi:hypothetical protein
MDLRTGESVNSVEGCVDLVSIVLRVTAQWGHGFQIPFPLTSIAGRSLGGK